MKITMTKGHLDFIAGALVPHASADKSRPALCGVLFDAGSVVTCDSYTLAIWEAAEGFTLACSAPVLLQASDIVEASKVASMGLVTVDIDTDEQKVTIGDGRAVLPCRVIEATFPDYRKVVESADTDRHEAFGLSGAIVAKLAKMKAGKGWGDKRFSFEHRFAATKHAGSCLIESSIRTDQPAREVVKILAMSLRG